MTEDERKQIRDQIGLLIGRHRKRVETLDREHRKEIDRLQEMLTADRVPQHLAA